MRKLIIATMIFVLAGALRQLCARAACTVVACTGSDHMP